MDLTNLNAAKQTLIDGMVNAGVMQVDAQKYYIPLSEVLVIFNEVISILTELKNSVDTNDTKIDELEARVEALEG